MPDFLEKQIKKFGKMSKLKMSIIGSVMAVLVVILGAVIGGCYSASQHTASMVNTSSKDGKIHVRVEAGMSSSDIGNMLVEKGVVSSKLSFWWNAKTKGADKKFQTGLFEFTPNMSTDEVLDILINGKISSVRVVIPEGFTVKQIAKRLDDMGLVSEREFLKMAKDYAPYDYIEANKDADYRMEGFLFPATYEIDSSATCKEIMDMMAETFDARLTADMRVRAKERNLSIYELVTLASLVEKEALFDEDRPAIAQVFFKRLAINMPLQSDTTVTYLIGAKEDVSIADTKVDSPYNTYQNYGLPPGPIACPGTESIKAVLYPADTNYLYFVADRDGHNHYSTNYDDHLAIVDKVR